MTLKSVAAFAAPAGVSFGNAVIPEEAGNFGEEGDFIYPNEALPDIWQPALTGKRGAYISVGTFRTLNTAANNSFGHTFMIDLDQKTTDFNRVNVELIRFCKSRSEYLSYLSGLEVDGRNLWDVHALTPLPKDYWQNLPSPLRENYKKVFVDQKLVQKFNSSEALSGLVGSSPANAGSLRDTITASDKSYASIRGQILGGKVTVLNGSLSGRQTYQALARALKARGIEVSALDVSNVMQYLNEGLKPRRGAGTPFADFLANLEALPFESGAQVLFTSLKHPVGVTKVDRWSYHARPAVELINVARARYDRWRKDGIKDLFWGEEFTRGLFIEHGLKQAGNGLLMSDSRGGAPEPASGPEACPGLLQRVFNFSWLPSRSQR